MPTVIIGGVPVLATRLFLTASQVQRTLRCDEAEIAELIRAGDLRNISAEDGQQQFDPDEVAVVVQRHVEAAQLGEHAYAELAAYLTGRLS